MSTAQFQDGDVVRLKDWEGDGGVGIYSGPDWFGKLAPEGKAWVVIEGDAILTDEDNIEPFVQRTEADIHRDLRHAKTEFAQRVLLAELENLRAQRTAEARASREIDLSDTFVRERPVASVHERTSEATDWMLDLPGGEAAYDHDMRAQATVWFRKVSSEVKADPEEFAEQARGMARRASGRYGESAEAARRAFMDAVAHLYKTSFNPGEVAQPEGEQSGHAESGVADYETDAEQEPFLSEDWEGEKDTGSEVGSDIHPEMPGATAGRDNSPSEWEKAYKNKGKRTWDEAYGKEPEDDEEEGKEASLRKRAIPGDASEFSPIGPDAPWTNPAIFEFLQYLTTEFEYYSVEEVVAAIIQFLEEVGYDSFDRELAFTYVTEHMPLSYDELYNALMRVGSRKTAGTEWPEFNDPDAKPLNLVPAKDLKPESLVDVSGYLAQEDVDIFGPLLTVESVEPTWMDEGYSVTVYFEDGPPIDVGPNEKLHVVGSKKIEANYYDGLDAQVGERHTLRLPASEVVMHLRMVDQIVEGELLPGYMVQLYDTEGRPISFPITAGEAGWGMHSTDLTMFPGSYQATRKHASKPVKGIAIYPDKRVEEVTISDYRAGQAIVGGLIEPVTLKDGSTMYVNEEFVYLFGPEDFNSIATDVAGLGGRPDLLMRGIKGPVYIVGPLDDEGYDTDITEGARRLVQRVSREATKKQAVTSWTDVFDILDFSYGPDPYGPGSKGFYVVGPNGRPVHDKPFKTRGEAQEWAKKNVDKAKSAKTAGSDFRDPDFMAGFRAGSADARTQPSVNSSGADMVPYGHSIPEGASDKFRKGYAKGYQSATQVHMGKTAASDFGEEKKDEAGEGLAGGGNKWVETLDLTDIYRPFDTGTMPFEQFRDQVVERIKALQAFAEDVELQDIADSLLYTEDVDEFRGEFDNFYDWADAQRVWVQALGSKTAADLMDERDVAEEQSNAASLTDSSGASWDEGFARGSEDAQAGKPAMDFSFAPESYPGGSDFQDGYRAGYSQRQATKTAVRYSDINMNWHDGPGMTHGYYPSMADGSFFANVEESGAFRIFRYPSEGGPTDPSVYEGVESSREKAMDEVVRWIAERGLSMIQATKKTAEKYRAEVTGIGEDRWSSNGLEFDTPAEAEAWLAGLSLRWFGYDMGRVVPTSVPRNQTVDLASDQLYQNFRSGTRKTAETVESIQAPDEEAAFQQAFEMYGDSFSISIKEDPDRDGFYLVTLTDRDWDFDPQTGDRPKEQYTGWFASRKTADIAPESLGIQVGDIYYTTWGYDQTNVNFYQVVRLTGAGVEVRPIGKTVLEDHGPGGLKVIPAPNRWKDWDVLTGIGTNGNDKESKVCRVRESGSIVLSRDHAAWKWNGNPVYETHPQFGH